MLCVEVLCDVYGMPVCECAVVCDLHKSTDRLIALLKLQVLIPSQRVQVLGVTEDVR